MAGYRDEYLQMQSELAAAQEHHLRDLERFAHKAWRRPLTSTETQMLEEFYRAKRNVDALGHADAIQACIVRILISPAFLYRVERDAGTAPAKQLTDVELATRLSFSLWSSLPDRELMEAAERGQLTNDPAALQHQARRMLRSPKARRMATEFFGQWLGFYHFDEFRGVDNERFPEFDESLRQSLYGEAISFFEHIIREDRPYSEILQADYSFINRRIADHYGVPWKTQGESESFSKRPLSEYHRGGMLGLGALLTATSAPLRTSPVKRGDWILRRLVGTPVPPPPADVGSIPAEEVLSDGLTVRDRLEVHRTQAECMNCHVRIDPLGFALENFDSLGRWRETYADGKLINASGELLGGQSITGLEGLKAYLHSEDRQFRRTLANRLVAYMLGRSESIADSALIERIVETLELEPQFSTAVLTVINSKQFRQIRGVTSSTLESNNPSTGASP